MKHWKRYALAGTILGLGAGGWLLVGSRLRERDGQRQQTDPSPDAAQQAELADLRRAVRRLTLSQVGTEFAKPAHPDSRNEDVAGPDREPQRATLNDVLDSVPADEQEEFLERLERTQTAETKARALARLAREAKDKAWETEVKSTISEAAKALDPKLFRSTEVSSVECGTTLCKVEIDQRSEAENNAFAGQLSTGMRTFGVRRGGKDDPVGEPLGWTLFVARAGHKLPRIEPDELVAMASSEVDADR